MHYICGGDITVILIQLVLNEKQSIRVKKPFYCQRTASFEFARGSFVEEGIL